MVYLLLLGDVPIKVQPVGGVIATALEVPGKAIICAMRTLPFAIPDGAVLDSELPTEASVLVLWFT